MAGSPRLFDRKKEYVETALDVYLLPILKALIAYDPVLAQDIFDLLRTVKDPELFKKLLHTRCQQTHTLRLQDKNELLALLYIQKIMAGQLNIREDKLIQQITKALEDEGYSLKESILAAEFARQAQEMIQTQLKLTM